VSPPDIAVAVATCGRPNSLARCLAALADGDARPGELIVVDQAPSRAAREIVEHCEVIPARYIEQPRLGLSASRNRALELTSAPILAVTDDDCVPDSGWVRAIDAAMERAPRPDAVTGSVEALGPQPPGTYAVSLREGSRPIDFTGRIIPWTVGTGANFAAPCDILRARGGWDERLGTGSPGMAAEDADLIYRILRSGGAVRYDPDVTIRHEWQPIARRLATRWSYGFGIGAMCGLWLRRGDWFAIRMLMAYARPHVLPLVRAAFGRQPEVASEHWRALASLPVGLVHGLRAQA
jgi:glycosyltransferase involved in cell wall biosynthesis